MYETTLEDLMLFVAGYGDERPEYVTFILSYDDLSKPVSDILRDYEMYCYDETI